eukprot:256512-Pelagomonas_calceolata.AAC.2
MVATQTSVKIRLLVDLCGLRRFWHCINARCVMSTSHEVSTDIHHVEIGAPARQRQCNSTDAAWAPLTLL